MFPFHLVQSANNSIYVINNDNGVFTYLKHQI